MIFHVYYYCYCYCYYYYRFIFLSTVFILIMLRAFRFRAPNFVRLCVQFSSAFFNNFSLSQSTKEFLSGGGGQYYDRKFTSERNAKSKHTLQFIWPFQFNNCYVFNNNLNFLWQIITTSERKIWIRYTGHMEWEHLTKTPETAAEDWLNSERT